MRRSYSKIRHIQESNLMLENRRLVENNRSFLMEQVQSVMLNLTIPTKNGNYIDKSKNITFSIGPLGKNPANEYPGILTTMTLNGQYTNSLTNQSLVGEYVNGEIMMVNPSDQLVDANSKNSKWWFN